MDSGADIFHEADEPEISGLEDNSSRETAAPFDSTTRASENSSFHFQYPPPPVSSLPPATARHPTQINHITQTMNPNDVTYNSTFQRQSPTFYQDMLYGPGPAIRSASPANFVLQSHPGGIMQPTPTNLQARAHHAYLNQGPPRMFTNSPQPQTQGGVFGQGRSVNNGPAMTSGYAQYLNFMGNIMANNPGVTYPNTIKYVPQTAGNKNLGTKGEILGRRMNKTAPLGEYTAAPQSPVPLGERTLFKQVPVQSQKPIQKRNLAASEVSYQHASEHKRLNTKTKHLRPVNAHVKREVAGMLRMKAKQIEEKKYDYNPPGRDTVLRDNGRDIWPSSREYYRNKGNGTIEMMNKIMAGSPITDLRKKYCVPRDEILRRMSMLATISLEVLETQGITREQLLGIMAQYEEGNEKDIVEIMMKHQTEGK